MGRPVAFARPGRQFGPPAGIEARRELRLRDDDSTHPPGRPGRDLFLISGLVLFLELACIRWFPAHVLLPDVLHQRGPAGRVRRHVGRLPAAPTGRPGCCGTRRSAGSSPSAAGLVDRPAAAARSSSTSTSPTRRTRTWCSSAARRASCKQVEFRFPLEIVLGVFFVLIALVMVGPGQEMGRAFNRVPNRGRAYALNLLGSLAGILLFAAGRWSSCRRSCGSGRGALGPRLASWPAAGAAVGRVARLPGRRRSALAAVHVRRPADSAS